jgi:hypothetical protein
MLMEPGYLRVARARSTIMVNRISTGNLESRQPNSNGDAHAAVTPAQGAAPNESRSAFRVALTLLGLPDPRAAQRCTCSLQVPYRPVNLHDAGFGLASVLDISRGGVRLLADEPIDPGEFVALLFTRLSPMFAGPTLMRVVHRTRLGTATWQLGGAWVGELPAQQMQALLPSSSLPH